MDEHSIVKNTYNQIAKDYTERYGDSPFLLEQLEKFSSKIPSKGKILDLGCGSGRATRHFIAKRFSVIGIDFSEGMLGLARKRLPDADFRCMDIKNLDFPDKFFDGVWSCFSLLHIPKREIKTILDECWRVLKKGGILYISVSLGKGREGFQEEWLKKGTKMFFYGMSKNGLIKHLLASKFSIEEIGIKKDTPENDNIPILYVFAKK